MKILTNKISQKLLGGSFGLLIGILLIPTAQAQSKEQILSLLQGYEWRLEPVRFTSLREDVDLTLMEIVADTSLMNAYRFRALEALKLFEKERVAKFLENYMNQSQTSSHLRRAFEAFSEGFSENQPQRVQMAAQRLLSNSDPHVRISAARALRTLSTSNARSAYRGYLNNETEEWIRQAIQE